MHKLLHIWHGWFLALFFFCAAMVFSNVFHWIVFRVLRRKQDGDAAALTGRTLGLQRYLGKPARAIFVLTCLFFVAPSLPIPRDIHSIVVHTLAVIFMFSLGWFATGAIYVGENLFLRRYDITAKDNMNARRVHTQFQLFRRVLIAFVAVITTAGILWTFHDDRLWKAGTGLLASAGIASLILATAAKSTASNFLAGLQIALTEPIHIDDVVIVQGQYGNIEEITSAYVVIRTWDLRRMIVPLSYFIENTFENWTRHSSDLLGYCYLYTDYSVPVEALRDKMNELLKASRLWDGKVANLQITNLKEATMEIRCLYSVRSSGDNSDLAAFLREQMIAFVRDRYPNALPQQRSTVLNPEQLQGAPAAATVAQLPKAS